jgi:phage terminase large subunit
VPGSPLWSHKPRIAGKASKGVGKSAGEAWAGWWFLTVWPHPKGVATSISGDNLDQNLWAEFAKWQEQSELLTSLFTHTSEKVFLKESPKTWFFGARTWPKDASGSEQAKTLAGTHADFVMALLDESGGIPRPVFAAVDAILANLKVIPEDILASCLAWIIQMGNPTDLSGPLFDACSSERELWALIEINGDPENPKRSRRVSKEWAQQLIDKWGRDNAFVRVNVLGQFPLGQSNALVSADDANKASRRALNVQDYRNDARILGVDVARFGEDRTILFPRQGRIAFRPIEMRSRDTMEVAGQVARVIQKWRPHCVFVDQTGVGGGVVDRLHELGHDQVIGVDSSISPDDSSYLNKRAEMWGLMAGWFRAGASIPMDPSLIREATAPTYKFTSAGKLQLESKDDIKKRLGVSPDLADALALTFAFPVATPDPAVEALPEFKHLVKRAGAQVAHEYDPHGGMN